MRKSQCIRKIRELKRVEPRKDWVLLTKTQILGAEPALNLFSFAKPVFAGFFALLFVLGIFQFSQSAVPGESLYYFKKIVEKSQIFFSSEEERPRMNLELANRRLQDLSQIAEKNEVKKLAPAMNEFQAKITEAAQNLTKVKKINREIVVQIQKLEENEQKVEEVLATKIETEEYDNALAQLVEREILEMEEKTLTPEDELLLEGAREDFENRDYSDALVKILDLSQE